MEDMRWHRLRWTHVLHQTRRRLCVHGGTQRPPQPAAGLGELNGDRLNHPFGAVDGEPRVYGEFDFEVGGRPKVAEPPASIRGMLARAMLSMSDQYGVDVRMSQEALPLFASTPSADARERRRLKEALRLSHVCAKEHARRWTP